MARRKRHHIKPKVNNGEKNRIPSLPPSFIDIDIHTHTHTHTHTAMSIYIFFQEAALNPLLSSFIDTL